MLVMMLMWWWWIIVWKKKIIYVCCDIVVVDIVRMLWRCHGDRFLAIGRKPHHVIRTSNLILMLFLEGHHQLRQCVIFIVIGVYLTLLIMSIIIRIRRMGDADAAAATGHHRRVILSIAHAIFSRFNY
jgi:hypothetical protein